MRKHYYYAAFAAALLCGSVAFVACDDDDDTPANNPNTITFENVATVYNYVQSGQFNGPIAPGSTATVTFNAGRGQTVMFAAMYAYSNDLFFAPENPGLPLYNDDGTPRTGDVSSYVKLWDNGTRVNDTPGPDISHPGTAEDGTIRQIEGNDGQGNTFPAASDMLKLTLAYDAVTSQFTLTLTNNSANTTNTTPISGGVWVVSNVLDGDLVKDDPFFEAGEKSSTQLTALAENGNTAPLLEVAQSQTGIITTLSPAIVVIYTGDTNPIYTLGQKDGGLGLSSLAQSGDTGPLVEALSKVAYVKRVYTTGNDWVDPSEKVSVGYQASQGDKLAFALMFGYSNDWFYANRDAVNPLSRGDITSNTILLDDGTAVNQYPGAGDAQALFGGTLMPQSNDIMQVGDTYPVPAVNKIIKVTIE